MSKYIGYILFIGGSLSIIIGFLTSDGYGFPSLVVFGIVSALIGYALLFRKPPQPNANPAKQNDWMKWLAATLLFNFIICPVIFSPFLFTFLVQGTFGDSSQGLGLFWISGGIMIFIIILLVIKTIRAFTNSRTT